MNNKKVIVYPGVDFRLADRLLLKYKKISTNDVTDKIGRTSVIVFSISNDNFPEENESYII
jgi:hypothetical protein